MDERNTLKHLDEAAHLVKGAAEQLEHLRGGYAEYAHHVAGRLRALLAGDEASDGLLPVVERLRAEDLELRMREAVRSTWLAIAPQEREVFPDIDEPAQRHRVAEEVLREDNLECFAGDLEAIEAIRGLSHEDACALVGRALRG